MNRFRDATSCRARRNLRMSIAFGALRRSRDQSDVREAGRELLVLAALLGASGKDDDARSVLEEGIGLLEYAAAQAAPNPPPF